MHLDTGVLIELLRRPPSDPWVAKLRQRLKDEPLYWSTVQYAELADWLRRHRAEEGPVIERTRALVEEVAPDREIALHASRLKAEARGHRSARDFALIDGLILATARSRGHRLLTLAREFSVFPDAEVLEPS